MARSEQFPNTSFQTALVSLTLDRAGGLPLHQQLTEALRDMVLSGRAQAGSRLPSSRQLAQELSVSRVTTLTALEQLVAEGYLVTRRGAGTYVAHDLPRPARAVGTPAALADPQDPTPHAPLTPGIPDLTEFPHAQWARHLERAWRTPEPGLLARPDPLGWPPLRTAIAAHLEGWRGLRCAPAQVIITSGASESFDLIGRALFAAGDIVAIEDPAFPPMLHALTRAGVALHPARVDAEGMPTGSLPAGMQGAVVTPSRGYPLGTTLPLPRRLALLDHAVRADAWVIEDDYDSEFRYTGQPLPALASLDADGRVIYVGSFSKTLSPALRLGYMVAPPHALPLLRDAIATAGPRASLVPQPALATFMAQGEFATHLRRMRRLYAERQRVLINALGPLDDLLTITPDPAGMHLVCGLKPACPLDDLMIATRAAQAGLGLRALSRYFDGPDAPQGLVLGYAGFGDGVLQDAAATLTTILRAPEGRCPP